MSDSVVIVAAKRTPIGSMNGQLLPLTSPQLASVAIKAAFAQSGLKLEDINGGMESMSNAPHMLPKARQGYRYGHFMALDHMAFDGLENAYDGKSMGIFADATAAKYGFTRADHKANPTHLSEPIAFFERPAAAEKKASQTSQKKSFAQKLRNIRLSQRYE